MKLIINIPDDVYTRLFDNGIQDNEIATDDICEMARALRLGTPIPDNATVCDIEQIKTKIITMSCRYSLARERGCNGQVEWSDRLIKVDDVLKVFEEYQKGGK